MGKVIQMNYEAEYERLKQQMQSNAEFYGQAIKEKDEEIDWHKKIIERILHI